MENKTTITNHTTNNTTNITNHFTINQTVPLRPYNDPKLPEDMDDIYEDAFEQKRLVQTYIERVHFSPDLPENHNMCITNMTATFGARIFIDGEWRKVKNNQLIDELVSRATESAYKWSKSDPKKKEYIKDFDAFLKDIDKKTFYKEEKEDIKLLLHDKYTDGTVDIKSKEQKQFIEN